MVQCGVHVMGSCVQVAFPLWTISTKQQGITQVVKSQGQLILIYSIYSFKN